jgi:hypothetical protein
VILSLINPPATAGGTDFIANERALPDGRGRCHVPRGGWQVPRGRCHVPRGMCHAPCGICHAPRRGCHVAHGCRQTHRGTCKPPCRIGHAPYGYQYCPRQGCYSSQAVFRQRHGRWRPPDQAEDDRQVVVTVLEMIEEVRRTGVSSCRPFGPLVSKRGLNPDLTVGAIACRPFACQNSLRPGSKSTRNYIKTHQPKRLLSFSSKGNRQRLSGVQVIRSQNRTCIKSFPNPQ